MSILCQNRLLERHGIINNRWKKINEIAMQLYCFIFNHFVFFEYDSVINTQLYDYIHIQGFPNVTLYYMQIDKFCVYVSFFVLGECVHNV